MQKESEIQGLEGIAEKLKARCEAGKEVQAVSGPKAIADRYRCSMQSLRNEARQNNENHVEVRNMDGLSF